MASWLFVPLSAECSKCVIHRGAKTTKQPLRILTNSHFFPYNMVYSRFCGCCFGSVPSVASPTPSHDAPAQDPISNSTPSAASCTTPVGSHKFIFDEDSGERVTGIANSGTYVSGRFVPKQTANFASFNPPSHPVCAASKYAAERPLEVRNTPYEERIEKLLQQEESALLKKREQQQS
jgi:hypothetical protein